MSLTVWHFRHWRARHVLYLADLNYRRWPSPLNAAAVERARRFLVAVEVGRP